MRQVVDSIPTDEMFHFFMKHLIFSFLRSGNKAKPGVDFCHSTPKPSRIRFRRKVRNRSALMGTECINIDVRGTSREWKCLYLNTRFPGLADPATCEVQNGAKAISLSHWTESLD